MKSEEAREPLFSRQWIRAVNHVLAERGADSDDSVVHRRGPGVVKLAYEVIDPPSGVLSRVTCVITDGRMERWRRGAWFADAVIRSSYDVLREVVFAKTPSAGQAAYQSGRLEVRGDVPKLMSAIGTSGALSPEVLTRIEALTA